jgi:hypothetical protein
MSTSDTLRQSTVGDWTIDFFFPLLISLGGCHCYHSLRPGTVYVRLSLYVCHTQLYGVRTVLRIRTLFVYAARNRLNGVHLRFYLYVRVSWTSWGASFAQYYVLRLFRESHIMSQTPKNQWLRPINCLVRYGNVQSVSHVPSDTIESKIAYGTTPGHCVHGRGRLTVCVCGSGSGTERYAVPLPEAGRLRARFFCYPNVFLWSKTYLK